MGEIEWDIQEIKRIKWIELIQANLVALFAFFLSFYYIKVGLSLSVFFCFTCLLLWILFAHALYTLITGELIDTKTSKLSHAFDKNRLGKKRWKRKKLIETIVIGIICTVCTILIFNTDFPPDTLTFWNLSPFIGAWIGFNTGSLIRTSALQ